MTKNLIPLAVLAIFTTASSFTSSQELALKNLFIDSRVSANESDLKHVLANVVPSILSDPAPHHALFARLYQERCLELEPDHKVGLYEVCPVRMTTDFEVPVIGPILDASCFFLFPPGALRNALKNAFSKQVNDSNDGPLSSLFKIMIDQVPEYHVPFAPLLAEFSEYFPVNIFTDFDHNPSLKALFANVLTYTDILSSKLQVAVLTLLPTIPKTVLDNKFLDLLLPRLYCAQPGEEAMVMGCVNDVVWEMVQTKKHFCCSYYQDKRGIFKIATNKIEYFEGIVQVIARNNPMVLLSNLESLQLSHIEPIIPMILQPFLDGIEGKLLCGDAYVKQSLSKVDIDILLNLTNLGKSDWKNRHYKRVFSRSYSVQEADTFTVPFDSPAKAVSSHGAIIPPVLSIVLQHSLPLLPASLSTSFHQFTLSKSALNPVNFLTYLTRTIPEDVYHSTVRRFMAGMGPLFSGKERNMVKWMLSVVDWAGFKKSNSQSEKNMTFKQRYLIHSVVFRQGAFRWSTTDQILNDCILACESIARLFYPLYVQKLLTVVQHVDENGNTVRNIEDLFMCPFVDKGWLLEHYGNIHVGDINDFTNVHRLHQKGNKEVQIETLIQFIKDCGLFIWNYYDEPLKYTQEINLRIRVVELVVSMLKQGYEEQAIMVAECFGPFKDKVLKSLGLNPLTPAMYTVSLMSKKREYVLNKCNEIVSITFKRPFKSEFNVFMNLLDNVPSFEAAEMVFDNVQELLFYNEFTDWLCTDVAQKIVQRLWSKCFTKDHLVANNLAKLATEIFVLISTESQIKLIDHVMSIIYSEQELRNLFRFEYDDFTYDIHDLFKWPSVSIVFKRFIIRCCLDVKRTHKVEHCLFLCGLALDKGSEEVKAFLNENFGDLVPMGLIEKSII